MTLLLSLLRVLLRTLGSVYHPASHPCHWQSPKSKPLCSSCLCVLPLISSFHGCPPTQSFPRLLLHPYKLESEFSAPSTSSQSGSFYFLFPSWPLTMWRKGIINLSPFQGHGEAAILVHLHHLWAWVWRWDEEDEIGSQRRVGIPNNILILIYSPCHWAAPLPSLPCHSHLLNSWSFLQIYEKLWFLHAS